MLNDGQVARQVTTKVTGGRGRKRCLNEMLDDGASKEQSKEQSLEMSGFEDLEGGALHGEKDKENQDL